MVNGAFNYLHPLTFTTVVSDSGRYLVTFYMNYVQNIRKEFLPYVLSWDIRYALFRQETGAVMVP